MRHRYGFKRYNQFVREDTETFTNTVLKGCFKSHLDFIYLKPVDSHYSHTLWYLMRILNLFFLKALLLNIYQWGTIKIHDIFYLHQVPPLYFFKASELINILRLLHAEVGHLHKYSGTTTGFLFNFIIVR